MKWIGQHIWSFISRFRSDVYLEATETGTIASGGNLGLDANNKIVKADTEAGELSFNGNTTNGVLTYGGTSTIDVESTFTFNGAAGNLAISSGTESQPSINLLNSNTDANGSIFNFNKTAVGADNDELGQIGWVAEDEGGGSHTFAQIIGTIKDATPGEEAGLLEFKVAEFDGTVTTGLKIDGDTNADGRVDVTIGAGGCTTSINGGKILLGSSDDAIGSIQRTTHDDGDGGVLRVIGGSATNGQTDKAGGDLQLHGGLGTGALSGGDIQFYSHKRGSSGTTIGTTALLSTFVAGSVNTDFIIYEDAGASTDDYYRVRVKANGETEIVTHDAAAMAAHYKVDADGDITFDPATGVVRAGWHGSTTRIKILPRDFVPNDVGRPAMIEDDSVGSNELFLHSHASNDLFAYVPIPSGYKATHVRIYGNTSSENFYVYEGNINSKTIVDIGTGTHAIDSGSGTENALATQLVSDTTNYLIIRVTSGGATEEVHGGYVTIVAV
jgi:hypothetical protein